MSHAFRCQTCNGEPMWQVLRIGDVVVSWACPEHLSNIAEEMQRDYEVTELSVKRWAKLVEVAEINRMIRAAMPDDGDPE